jgi:hypothetical protein
MTAIWSNGLPTRTAAVGRYGELFITATIGQLTYRTDLPKADAAWLSAWVPFAARNRSQPRIRPDRREAAQFRGWVQTIYVLGCAERDCIDGLTPERGQFGESANYSN